MKAPLVTVLMPVYNNAEYLPDAIQSILDQTYTNFELLIIDDGSTDKSLEIIKSFKDKRIKLKCHKNNFGLIKTLNEGIGLAQGKYISRMDGDDVADIYRLEKQANYLESHSEVGVLGSWIQVFGSKNYVWQTSTNTEEIRARLLFESTLAHPSVMFRTSILPTKPYDKHYPQAEDYRLWTKLIDKTQVTNLPEVLLRYRAHGKQTAATKSGVQQKTSAKIRESMLKKLSISLETNEKIVFHKLGSWQKLSSTELKQAQNILEKIIAQNNKKNYFNKKSLVEIVGERWLGVCYVSRNNLFMRFFIAVSNPFLFYYGLKYYFRNFLS